jgi:hypothetical protein
MHLGWTREQLILLGGSKLGALPGIVPGIVGLCHSLLIHVMYALVRTGVLLKVVLESVLVGEISGVGVHAKRNPAK